MTPRSPDAAAAIAAIGDDARPTGQMRFWGPSGRLQCLWEGSYGRLWLDDVPTIDRETLRVKQPIELCVVRHRNGSLAFHQALHDDMGELRSIVERPVTLAVDHEDGLDGLSYLIESARDGLARPVIDITSVRVVAE